MSLESTENHPPSIAVMDRLGQHVAEALRFWEPSRLVYNLALLAVVAAHFTARMPEVWNQVSFDAFLALFFLAVLANVVYCAAYLVDLFVQLSGLRDQWRIGRVVLLTVGTLFACVIAHFMLSGGLHNDDLII